MASRQTAYEGAYATWHTTLLLSLILFASTGQAETTSLQDADVRLGGVAWAKATYPFEDESVRLPDLDLYRVHLWGTSQIGTNWTGTFRLHAGTAPGILTRYNQNGTIFIYQAFLNRQRVFNDADNLTLGLATNAYLKRLYRLNGTRFISRLLSQRLGYLTPSPLGIRYEIATENLLGAVMLETTASHPNVPTSHIAGIGSTFHWKPASAWTLSAHGTYRHRSNQTDAPPSEAVFVSALTYQDTRLTVSAEIAGRHLLQATTTMELGGGIVSHVKLYQALHLFGHFMLGNQGVQDILDARFTWRTGPLLLLENQLKVALILDVEHRDTTTFITSLAASKQF